MPENYYNTFCLKDGTFLIGLIPSTLCLVIAIWIFIASIKQLRTKQKIKPLIKIIHYISCILSIILICLQIYYTLLCDVPRVFTIIGHNFYITLSLCIICTLLLRIHHTFKESALALSNSQQLILIILFVLFAIFDYSVTIIINTEYWNLVATWILIGAIFGGSVSLYGMYIFTHKMYELSQLRRISIHENKIELSQNQLKVFQSASKYISLLGLAFFTTWIIYVFVIITAYTGFEKNRFAEIIFNILWSLDCAVNVICLYLEYSFGAEYYDKYCSCFGNFCLYLFKKIAIPLCSRYLS